MRTALDKSASPSEKLDFIFSHIYNFEFSDGRARYSEGGTIIDFSRSFMNMEPKFFGLSTYEEMVFYLNTLKDEGYIKLNTHTRTSRPGFQGNQVAYSQHGEITFKGLSHLHEIENKGILSNKCFVAMSFDENKNGRLNAIKLACVAYEFDAFVIDEYHEAGNQTIDSKIIAAIKSSNFCIADFTGINQGAYMEAGFAMGRNMKVIFTCEKKDFETNKKHFDVNHYPFICYEGCDDLTEQLKNEIGAYIK